MDWNKHFDLVGKHAPFPASSPSWLRKTSDEMYTSYLNGYSKLIGTGLHDIAQKYITKKRKMSKQSAVDVYVHLASDYGIPDEAIDISKYFDNLRQYVNDAVGFRMDAEVVLKYSDRFFGTADAIAFRKDVLRIHDLKTGTTPVHPEQLLIYSALFCLEYGIRPGEISIENRIYQSMDILVAEPTAEDILPIMDKIETEDKRFIIMQGGL